MKDMIEKWEKLTKIVGGRGRPRESPTGRLYVKRNFSLSPELFAQLKAESRRVKRPMSQIVRWALEEYLAFVQKNS